MLVWHSFTRLFGTLTTKACVSLFSSAILAIFLHRHSQCNGLHCFLLKYPHGTRLTQWCHHPFTHSEAPNRPPGENTPLLFHFVHQVVGEWLADVHYKSDRMVDELNGGTNEVHALCTVTCETSLKAPIIPSIHPTRRFVG